MASPSHSPGVVGGAGGDPGIPRTKQGAQGTKELAGAQKKISCTPAAMVTGRRKHSAMAGSLRARSRNVLAIHKLIASEVIRGPLKSSNSRPWREASVVKAHFPTFSRSIAAVTAH